MSHDEDFAKLRKLLSYPTQDGYWNEQFCALIQGTYTNDPEYYFEVWVPYCEQYSHLFKYPLYDLYTIEDLHKYHKVAPFGLFELNLFDTRISLSELMAFFSTPLLQRVHSLFLGRNNIELYTINELSKSPYSQNIRLLELAENELDSTDIKILAKTQTMTSLEELDISLNYIDDEGAVAIANSASFQNLRQIDISGTQITQIGIEYMQKSKHLASLQDIIT